MTRIVFDENIPFGEEAFSLLGETVSKPGRAIVREDLLDAELLIVRSITKVDQRLLEGTPVRFVGTATIGTDHVDRAHLAEAGIAFADAAGCNANSVSEYVAAALLHLERERGGSFEGKITGVVGVGNVGRRTAEKLRILGMTVLENDPPRAEREGSDGFVDLKTLLAEADLITLHTPLEESGPHPTRHLIAENELAQMKRDAFLFNTSRGAVVSGRALLAALSSGRMGGAVLDVWENEPTPDSELLRRVDLATPHIAGYSLDGKLNGTRIMFEAACRHLGKTLSWKASWNPKVDSPEIVLQGTGRASLFEAASRVYSIGEDDRRMREILDVPESDRGAYFDRLRKEYPVRREFPNYRTIGGDEAGLRGLGFA